MKEVSQLASQTRMRFVASTCLQENVLTVTSMRLKVSQLVDRLTNGVVLFRLMGLIYISFTIILDSKCFIIRIQ